MCCKYLFFIYFFIHPCIYLSQNAQIDSLINFLKSDKSDTTKLIHLYQLSDENETIGNYEDGLLFGKQAVNLADLIIKYSNRETQARTIYVAHRYKAKAYNNIGLIYFGQGNFMEALKSHNSSLKIKMIIDDQRGIASSYNNIGNLYNAQGNYVDALKSYLESLKIREKIGDKVGIATSYNNIGTLYKAQGNYSDALKMMKNVSNIRRKIFG